ncbi:MAG: SapC family protein, partial [Gammaproteobacteria bacterium]|nr:SapC family protein [Gammaproteobacteria bacterium]
MTDLPTPPGYERLTPLDRQKHAGLGLRQDQAYRFAAQLNAIYIVATEFFVAAKHYPIVFGKDSATGAFLPVAITGLTDKQNLFVDNNGMWRKDCYVPAYVRRYPFSSVQL